jgi:hypothetical protein
MAVGSAGQVLVSTVIAESGAPPGTVHKLVSPSAGLLDLFEPIRCSIASPNED